MMVNTTGDRGARILAEPTVVHHIVPRWGVSNREALARLAEHPATMRTTYRQQRSIGAKAFDSRLHCYGEAHVDRCLLVEEEVAGVRGSGVMPIRADRC